MHILDKIFFAALSITLLVVGYGTAIQQELTDPVVAGALMVTLGIMGIVSIVTAEGKDV